MLPIRDDKFLLIALGAAAMAVVFAWQIGFNTGLKLEQTRSTTQTQTPLETGSVVGEITDITGGVITLQAFIPTQDNRKVATNSETIFERIVPKDQEAYQNEINAFDAKIKEVQRASSTPLSPEEFPLPVTFEKTSLGDLRPGDIIQVDIAENVLATDQVVAKRIVVQPSLPVVEGAATTSSQ
ncbi:hypothetical protein HY415_03020 [Candidatus Kaiserbacteria bacterium]|nr:hypothetical protein [Candidatus Kaiserbacteria bacterium]